ncbi:hypothetical protein [Lewinella sp. W8]|uniref:DUF6940 family protein n=1 Tax=Lewinella sp. W8 TaxID=2528208 RepID=UPI0010673679|nr:hypothetical protein [Lewinella sp. W8]MTB50223.1 hypothetical protein [Lewinella sp. W8]
MSYTLTPLPTRSPTGQRYGMMKGAERMSFREVFNGWRQDDAFRLAYHEALKQQSDLAAFWEHPLVTSQTLDAPYECALVSSGALARLRPNPEPFGEYLRGKTGTVAFANLRGDAMMVVPAAGPEGQGYAHLLDFVREASPGELHDFWRAVGRETLRLLPQRGVYLNTHGLGVSWLHVRLDSRPKYYSFAAYR